MSTECAPHSEKAWANGSPHVRSLSSPCRKSARPTKTSRHCSAASGTFCTTRQPRRGARGRVAIASRAPAIAHRVALGPSDFDSAGRWLEADFEHAGHTITVVSTYVHSGEVGSPKQVEKFRFLDAMTERMAHLSKHNRYTVVVGDLNVGHRTLDIKNWKGNKNKAGFLVEERAYFDRLIGSEDDTDYNAGAGLGWIDVGRRDAGEVPGPYTWWSQRGQAFDTDTGWRIDYHLATPPLAATVSHYTVDRASAYDQRWSDHAPVVVDYAL